MKEVDASEVTTVIAVDGGYTETFVREEYPSACIAFFTFGPLLFKLSDLRGLDTKRFIAPDDLQKLKNIERYTLVLPTKGIRHQAQPSLAATIRKAVFDFFDQKRGNEGEQLMTSLRWFLFRRWQRTVDESFQIVLAHCPFACGHGALAFRHSDPAEKRCPTCDRPIYLTDVFRLHERVDEETGGSGIVAYVMTMLEQLVLVHLIHNIMNMKEALLRQILFIKDGPLAFFGLVAPLYKPMRELVEFLLSEPRGRAGPTLRLVGLEKSGAFVEHAASIQDRLRGGSYLVVGDDYIRKYIVPGGDGSTSYGQNTYYGQKVFFRAKTGEMHVATVPATSYTGNPKPESIPHLDEILGLVGELKCSMYDNALIPVALANKLVSLSDFPSQRILTTFARSIVKQ
ncbi:MAG: DNA double-strand break repair nuclease NurA [Myxococcales bacterium]|nr:DNA double-strand break repair nuclease NurA [Myxococcales bacterium]